MYHNLLLKMKFTRLQVSCLNLIVKFKIPVTNILTIPQKLFVFASQQYLLIPLYELPTVKPV